MSLNKLPTWARHRPSQQEAPANVSEQVANPADMGTSSAIPPEQSVTIPPQGKVLIIELSPMNFIFANYNYPCNFSVEVIPSATSANQPIVPTTSLRQRQEILLNQVSRLILPDFSSLIPGFK
jgi:hypothetical protein